jgi:hypothetical protein
VPVQVYRCANCGREVLVRRPGPLSEAEIARRIEEEHRPAARGRGGSVPFSERARDDIWAGISALRDAIPRDALPDRCPACQRDALVEARTVE